MTTVASLATTTQWCLYCPDTIQPGEAVLTDPKMRDPFGGQGYAHMDCGEVKGWSADELGPGAPPPSDVRSDLREHIRAHGPIAIDLDGDGQ